jgi:hypothetical protein
MAMADEDNYDDSEQFQSDDDMKDVQYVRIIPLPHLCYSSGVAMSTVRGMLDNPNCLNHNIIIIMTCGRTTC